MKTMMIIITLLMSSVAMSAGFDDVQERLEDKFRKLTASEALAWAMQDHLVIADDQNIGLPGTSSFFRPLTSLCVAGNQVKTTRPIRMCTLWMIDDNQTGSNDNGRKYFASRWEAEEYGENTPTCVEQSAPVYYSKPINYVQEACVLWTADNGEDGFNEGRKYFKRHIDAEDYADGHPVSCAQTAMVSKTIPTTFKVDFYRKEYGPDKDNRQQRYLGSHTYSLPACGGMAPVPAN